MFAVASVTGSTPYVVKLLARESATPGAPLRRFTSQAGSRQICSDARIMAIHAQASDSPVAATEFRATLGALGITQHRVAQLFGVGPRSVRRWQNGDRRVPCGVSIVIRLLATRMVTVVQVEQAAVPIPARANGSAKLRATPTSLRVEPAPARAKAAPRADPGLATAEKVCALTPEACRWPCGDPGHPDFHFCGNPVTRRPYCERHRGMAYVASLKSRSPSYGSSRSTLERGVRLR
jgi:GcrA cell cycle regulator